MEDEEIKLKNYVRDVMQQSYNQAITQQEQEQTKYIVVAVADDAEKEEKASLAVAKMVDGATQTSMLIAKIKACSERDVSV